MTRCAIYIRRSRKDKNNPGHRLEYQRQVLPEYAKSQGWKFEIFDEGMMSASNIRNLVQLNRIISRIKEFNVILAIDYSRFSRDSSAQDYVWFIDRCAENKIKLATPQEIYDASIPSGWQQLYFKSGQSAVEIQYLKERLRQGKQVSRDKGLWQGGVVFFGYKYNKDKKRLEPEPKEAKIVQKICQSVVQRSMAATVKKFARYKTKRGVPIDLWWVMKLTSENRLNLYCGMIKNSQGDYIQGQHPPIISNQLRRDVLLAKSRRHKDGAGFFGTRTLFGGLKVLRCGYCSSPVVVRYVQRYPSGHTDYYNCALIWTPRKELQCRESRYFQSEKINEVLITDLIKVLQNKKILERFYRKASRAKKSPNSKKVIELSNHIEKEENRKHSLVKALGRLRNDQEIISEIEEINRTISNLQNKLSQDQQPRKLSFRLEDLIRISEKIQDFRNFSRDKKREIIKLAIKQVRFFRERLEVDYVFLAKPRIISLQGVCRKYTARSGRR